jgi:hypothetical protein
MTMKRSIALAALAVVLLAVDATVLIVKANRADALAREPRATALRVQRQAEAEKQAAEAKAAAKTFL